MSRHITGCRSAKFLEIHHIIHRAAGGTHDPSLLLLVCSAHHRLIHRGALKVSGTAPDHLEFRRPHATWPVPAAPAPSPSPRPTQNAAYDLHADALDALRRLGFSAAPARQALAASSGGGDIETLLREALTHLRPTVRVSRASEATLRYGSRARCAAPSSRTADGAYAARWSHALATIPRTATGPRWEPAGTGVGLLLAGLLFSCAAGTGVDDRSDRGGTTSSSPREGRAGSPDSVSMLVAEVLGLVEQRGAVYFADVDNCEEWGAKVEQGRIALQRDYYFPTSHDTGEKDRRFRQSGTIEVRQEGLALSIQSSWSREEYSDESKTWKQLTAARRVSLCGQAEPTLRRVERDSHYSIGGAELYLSRRACEADIARNTNGPTLARKC